MLASFRWDRPCCILISALRLLSLDNGIGTSKPCLTGATSYFYFSLQLGKRWTPRSRFHNSLTGSGRPLSIRFPVAGGEAGPQETRWSGPRSISPRGPADYFESKALKKHHLQERTPCPLLAPENRRGRSQERRPPVREGGVTLSPPGGCRGGGGPRHTPRSVLSFQVSGGPRRPLCFLKDAFFTLAGHCSDWDSWRMWARPLSGLPAGGGQGSGSAASRAEDSPPQRIVGPRRQHCQKLCKPRLTLLILTAPSPTLYKSVCVCVCVSCVFLTFPEMMKHNRTKTLHIFFHPKH